MVEAVDYTPTITIEQIKGTETRRLSCSACDWLETAGSKSAATRKKNTHLADHAAATHGAAGIPTILDAIEGDVEMPEGAYRDPVPVGDVEYLRSLREQVDEHIIDPDDVEGTSDDPDYGGPIVEAIEPPEVFHTRACTTSGQRCDGSKGCYAVGTGKSIRDLIEASSLGTSEAQALRATVSDEHAARIVERARELEVAAPTAEEPAAAAPVFCPGTQQLCKREAEWGNPCDHDDDGDRICERLGIRTKNGWSVTPNSEDPDDIAAAAHVAQVIEEGGEEFTREVWDKVQEAMIGPVPDPVREMMNSLLPQSVDDIRPVSVECRMPTGWAAPKSREELERRLATIPPHTRTEYHDEAGNTGPDYCAECSEAAQDWVVWPCPEMAPRMPENDLPDIPLAVTLTRSRLAAQRGPSDADKDQPDSLWHKARADSVSATLAAKLGSAHDVDYLIAREVRERLNAQRFWGNAYTRWGKEREVHIENAAFARHGIEPESHLFFARANPRHTASPDGIAIHPLTGEVRLGEYKTSGKELTWAKMVANGYYDQVQWQLYVLEATHCWLMWEWRHGEGKDYNTYVPEPGGEHLIMRDDNRIAELVERADRFLAELDAAREQVAEHAPVDPELLHLVTEHLEAKAAAKQAEEMLREYCETNGVKSLEIEGVAKVSYSYGSPRATFDREAFDADFPGVYDRYKREGAPPERATLRVTPKGEDEG